MFLILYDKCYVKPNMEVIQQNFQNGVATCLDLNYFVKTWGRNAKIPERRRQRVTIGKYFFYLLRLNMIFNIFRGESI